MTNPPATPRALPLLLMCCFLFSSAFPPAVLRAQDDAKKEEAGDQAGRFKDLSTTEHSVDIAGSPVRYEATAGKMIQADDAGKEKAEVFFVAYRRPGMKVEQRPITFCFNGGPGSSSVWLHLGMLGPRRVMLPDDASIAPPPYHLHDNPFSLLDVTDLVFIDPVSTGFSRPAEGEDKKQFHGYDEDLNSVAQFIHDYVTIEERWASPKYVLGESYGGLRAAGLAERLQSRYRLELNGICLISAVLDFSTIRFADNNPLPYLLFLPSYTATAWYHKALPEPLQQRPLNEVLAAAESFALETYSVGLLKGASLDSEARAALQQQLARLTGLSEGYVEDSRLRIEMSRFAKELLRSQGKTIGRFDSRYQGTDRDDAGDRYEYDPSNAAIAGPFTATLNDYLRRELEYKEDRVYEILTGRVHPWNYGRFENRYVDASESLRSAMVANPHLQVFVACGYYDLATPYFAMDYTLDHLELPDELRANIRTEYYEAGHMMYIHEPSLASLRKHLEDFYHRESPTDKGEGD